MNEKRRKAASLSYNLDKHQAPIVSAAGKGYVAEDIIKLAKEHNVPIVEDESLAELLTELNVNEAIPEELYQVVAEVFAFIYEADRKYADKS
ncbi:EscU/YscU/HrcU family type III secretion system export apparatus switch protein [Oceanobacillus alkalisoli]|uniref:EscU/YscU/HrcU family type III secretion system export apparatus switch protein n=1 Tax=Oceanobacillus alkalisoli TaxID=2925113 RepID=UPI001EF00E87|nr:EscU/YscU/HrcU family type III secretion system export apparatus switch protein [Oceanobacillus alkalisoli]MCF3942448.1 EscU/YscU/HrcU family type III secretion system export apparatus switch protein [Oceanobacillus alkalisoli]MCG5103505.1 EscU/YscU/HrcU family type III secretion system export apparatus switch protein [Oceanobacillus alkalisoli]